MHLKYSKISVVNAVFFALVEETSKESDKGPTTSVVGNLLMW